MSLLNKQPELKLTLKEVLEGVYGFKWSDTYSRWRYNDSNRGHINVYWDGISDYWECFVYDTDGIRQFERSYVNSNRLLEDMMFLLKREEW